MVRQRWAMSSLGCLVLLLLVAAAGYFGVNIGEHYFRFYQFQDSMRQEVKFAAHNSDALILRHLRVFIRRTGGHVHFHHPRTGAAVALRQM